MPYTGRTPTNLDMNYPGVPFDFGQVRLWINRVMMWLSPRIAFFNLNDDWALDTKVWQHETKVARQFLESLGVCPEGVSLPP